MADVLGLLADVLGLLAGLRCSLRVELGPLARDFVPELDFAFVARVPLDLLAARFALPLDALLSEPLALLALRVRPLARWDDELPDLRDPERPSDAPREAAVRRFSTAMSTSLSRPFLSSVGTLSWPRLSRKNL
ncbi:MAG: hypothetical protein M3016_00145 [Actinomycetota bacterium]|nr:hypothetical protein [Actinomycetota bacterium]